MVATMSARNASPIDGIVLERVRVGLADQFGRDVGMIEPLGDAVDDRRFERVVMQDRSNR